MHGVRCMGSGVRVGVEGCRFRKGIDAAHKWLSACNKPKDYASASRFEVSVEGVDRCGYAVSLILPLR